MDSTACPAGEKWNPFDYWRIQEIKFPRLGRLARRVLCATASTAGVVRIFSTAGFIVSCRRARIGDNLFENLLFNNFNGDLRPFSDKTEELVGQRKRKRSEADIE